MALTFRTAEAQWWRRCSHLPMTFSLDQLEATISRAPAEEQRVFLAHLPQLLHLPASDLGFLKAAERSFQFWDNPDDAIYDRL